MILVIGFKFDMRGSFRNVETPYK